ncbi:MAG: hypothetical protein GC179_23830 [Anaerolineaceae bacterium]|nr:hypothetical protein [Anaerolineaceae bacterium]
MANLTEVQMALKQGDKAKANQLLKSILQQNPSADAWVMAARMTSNPETAKLHLQRALAFDSKHVKARDMLRDLGGTQKSASAALTGGLLTTFRSELEKFGANKPVLRDLSPSLRMVTALSLYTLILALILVVVASLLSPTAPLELPAFTPVTVYQGDTLISQWNTEGLNITNLVNVVQDPNVLSKEQINFTVTDDNGSHKVQIYLYDDVAGIVNDGVRMTALTTDGTNKMDIVQTAVIIYPADMNELTVSLLESALKPAPTAPV